MELGLRLFVGGSWALADNWIQSDAFLVAVDVVSKINAAIVDSDALNLPMILRTIRLARLDRMVRLLVQFRDLWTLVRGIMGSCGTMFYTLILLAVMLYLFGCLSIELITNNAKLNSDPETMDLVATHFVFLPDAMLTLMQFVCLDSVAAIYRPDTIEMSSPFGYSCDKLQIPDHSRIYDVEYISSVSDWILRSDRDVKSFAENELAGQDFDDDTVLNGEVGSDWLKNLTDMLIRFERLYWLSFSKMVSLPFPTSSAVVNYRLSYSAIIQHIGNQNHGSAILCAKALRSSRRSFFVTPSIRERIWDFGGALSGS